MKLKDLCAVTDCELCIIFGSVQCWAKKTKTAGIDKSFILRQWLDYEIVDIQIFIDCWDEYYLEIFLKTLDKQEVLCYNNYRKQERK